MEFNQKLTMLMHVFKISNSALARDIHVDASLISRWKSGARKISLHSPHIASLATYFVHIDAFPYQKAYLDRLLRNLMHRDPQHATDEERSLALANWFMSTDPVPVPEEPEKFLFSDESEPMLSQIGRWLTPSAFESKRSMMTEHPTASALHPAESVATTSKIRIYPGLVGKRQAILEILDEALTTNSPQDFLLFSEEPMNWLLDDPDFTVIWANRLRRIIEQGHTVSIIHVVNRSAQETLGIINHWLPLHLSGQIRSYYDPRYNNPSICQTLFIVRGKAALISQSTRDDATQSICLLIRDDEVINHYTRVFQSYLHYCRPLFSGYSVKQYDAYLQTQKHISQQAQRIISLCHQPDVSLLPEPVMDRLFTELLRGYSSSCTSEIVSLLKEKQTETCETVFLLSEEWLENAVLHGALITSDCTLFLKSQIRLSLTETAAWIRRLIRQVTENAQYHILLFDPDRDLKGNTHCLRYFERHAAVFASFPGDTPFVLSISEANSLYALGQYLDRLIGRIPKIQKDRSSVIQRLTAAADQISEQIKKAK